MVELVYTLVLGTSAERRVGSRPTLRSNNLNMIPYELVKIYREMGIDLNRFTVDYCIGECDESYPDRFIYKSF